MTTRKRNTKMQAAEAVAGNFPLLLQGIDIHLGRFNPERKDVVFRSPADAGEAARYLQFIRALGQNAGRLQVVLRDVDPSVAQAATWSAHGNFAMWLKALKLENSHAIVTTNSPNRSKPAYRNWIGFRLVPHCGRPNHYLVAGTFMLAALNARASDPLSAPLSGE